MPSPLFPGLTYTQADAMRRERPDLVLDADGYGRNPAAPPFMLDGEGRPDKYTDSLDNVWSMTYFAHAIEAVVSGGQTGADRGGLDAALVLEVPMRGWVPRGRRAEDGMVPEKYTGLLETPSADYRARTERNVKDSDATLIFTHGPLTGGSKLTADFCQKHGKPWLQIDFDVEGDRDYRFAALWLQDHRARVVNVAGQRESKSPGIQNQVAAFMGRILALFSPPDTPMGSPFPEDGR